MRLLIISHTPHYIDADGKVVGWGPTVSEINNLTHLFGQITHIACLHKNKVPPKSAIGYNGENINFVPIKPIGGKGVINKLSIIANLFNNLRVIRKELKYADYFQFRAPVSIGLYIIPYLIFFSDRAGWYKYAGNWVQKNAPLSYRIQKWMLSRQKRPITINGSWPNQPPQCYSFENPCLTDSDRELGQLHTNTRRFDKKLNLCFVGEVNEGKGIYRVLEALSNHPNLSVFNKLDIVGSVDASINIDHLLTLSPIETCYLGVLPRDQVFEIYKESDIILLPSSSEGFPKVIAEAANFGCVPVVSNVSAIGQYVNESNGFVWDIDKESFADFFSKIDFTEPNTLKNKSQPACNMADLFTYSHYNEKLKTVILKDVPSV